MKVIISKNSGFCYGVKRAVDTALTTKEEHNERVYTLGPLIHNNDVVDHLKQKHIYPIELECINDLKEEDIIIIRSHGVPLEILNKLKEKKLKVIDATCPYVSNIHKKVEKYYNEGYKILIVGDSSHPEVIGINGWCDNSAIICKDGEELDNLPRKICIVAQTTEKIEHWEKVLRKVISQSKEIIAFNTICNATSVRQQSAESLSKEVDKMIVVGGKNSSNTTKLYEICKKNCANTIHVENASEIPADFIDNYSTIGVAAGASTPDWIIKEAINKMSNEQLEYMEKNNTQIHVGQIVEGEIIYITSKEAYVNIGYKSDALLPINEVSKEENADLNNILKNGEQVKGKIIRLGSENHPPVISLVELNREDAYREIKEAFENKTTISGKVKEVVKGGLILIYKDIIRVFLPASHIQLTHVEDLSSYIGQELIVNIVEFEQVRNNTRIVASRREILKESQEKLTEKTWANLEKDTIVKGVVRRLTNFGAFVEVGGIDGLLHITEMSWGRISSPSEILKVGEEISVYVLDINKESKKLALSLKKIKENPWNDADIKYPVGTIVLGKIVRFATFGAFVELEPGIDGLVHISQISHKRVEKAEDVLKIGENIKAKILDVNKENKKIGLSIKEVNDI
ncbi:bifunctional 4-hydroxy-3-methylbut-2-enyl diphosphate reductase/30S ribosomal protein S1 [Clostridium malenominatum]|uniref:4-hydroxy-3-methylbut-2-enyl diphosphate reductase n=1 Tax=Clostridium malenominatum TaxID=1539 RepID=A0ABN1IX82_9CLOT